MAGDALVVHVKDVVGHGPDLALQDRQAELANHGGRDQVGEVATGDVHAAVGGDAHWNTSGRRRWQPEKVTPREDQIVNQIRGIRQSGEGITSWQ